MSGMIFSFAKDAVVLYTDWPDFTDKHGFFYFRVHRSEPLRSLSRILRLKVADVPKFIT
jgi:hypothetical protein